MTVTVTAKAAIRRPILYELWKTISCSRSPASLTMRDPGGLTTARYDRCRSHVVCRNGLRKTGDCSIVRVLSGWLPVAADSTCSGRLINMFNLKLGIYALFFVYEV